MGFSAFFSGSETALFSISSIQQHRLRRETTNKSSLRILRLLESPRRLIVTIIMGNEFVNVSISAIAASTFNQLFPGNKWLPILVMTVTILFLGEITPKSFAISRPMIYSRVISAPLLLFSTLFLPIRFIVEKILDGLTFFTGGYKVEPRPISEAEFRQLTAVGVEQGELDEDEADMIFRVFDLGETTVEHIMTPRTEIFAFPNTANIDEVINKLRVQKYSRVPIFVETIDNVVGILHANDLLRYKLEKQNLPLDRISRPPVYVPGSMKADDMLNRFRKNQSHLAIVVDEFGGTAGLVTLDDVIGELFGELPAERSGEDFTYKICENEEIIIAGPMELDEFGELVQNDFSDEPVETVGGMVFHHFGRLPFRGDIILINNLRFTVLSLKDNRIWRLRIRKGVTK